MTLSGLPQLVLAVEDGIPRSGSEELRSIRSVLFGDRAATSKVAPQVPIAGGCEGSETRPGRTRRGPAVPVFAHGAAPPGQRVILGPSKLALRRMRALGLGASGFV